MKVMFICTGNTCRSPMAEGIMKKILEKEKADNIICGSAGIFAKPNERASENAIKVCARIGVDIKNHRAKTLKAKDIDNTDLFVPMAKSHAVFLMDEFGIKKDKIFFMEDIPDPFGMDEKVYKECRDLVERGVKKLWNYIKKKSS